MLEVINMNLYIVEKVISVRFTQLGRLIARRPFFFIVVPVIVSCLLSPGLYFLKRESDINYLFGSQTGRVNRDKHIIKSLFHDDQSNYDWTRTVENDPFAVIIIVSEDQRSLLEKHHFEKILKIDSLIRNITVRWDDRDWNYSQLCSRKEGECLEQSIIKDAERVLNNKNKFKYPTEFNYTNYNTKYTALNFGGVELNNEDEILSSKAVKLIYLLKKSDAAYIWQHQFLHETKNLNFEGIRTSHIAAISISEELERNAETVQPLCSVAVILMVIFGMCVCLNRDWVKANPWLGLVGCISAGLGVLSAFGIVLLCGVPFNDIVASVPYLMLGIGMDDTFVLLAAWKRTDPKDTVEERMSASYSEAAVSITITSVTNFVSFLVGVSMPFPIIRIFCIYTAIAVLFSYTYQITFFGGFMALNGRREKRNLHPFTFKPVLPKSLTGEKSFLYRLMCTGGNESAFSENLEITEDFELRIFLRDYLGNFLTKPFVKGFVILAFIVYFALALVGCWNIKDGLEESLVFPYDSYIIPFLKERNTYFGEYGDRLQIVFTDPMDYSNVEVQNNIDSLFQRLENTSYFGDSSLTESWLRSYLHFTRNAAFSRMMSSFDLENKQEFIDGLKNVFLKFFAAKRFKNDLVFNENATEILASRFILQTTNVRSSQSAKAMLLNLYKIVDETNLPIAIYAHSLPMIEQQILAKSVSIQTICIAAAIMMVIFFIFIPNLICAACVAFSIVSIQIGVLGYMSFWSVRLDTISMMNLIMCVGFSVDYSSHISYVFQVSKLQDANEKIKWSLYSVGTPIIYGCLSTILGVFILSFTPSYIFVVFFKVVFLVIILALLHGLFLLPVLLSIFNCCSIRNSKHSEKHSICEEEEVRKKFDNHQKEINKESDDESCESGQCSQASESESSK